jgi:hypothetical protein
MTLTQGLDVGAVDRISQWVFLSVRGVYDRFMPLEGGWAFNSGAGAGVVEADGYHTDSDIVEEVTFDSPEEARPVLQQVRKAIIEGLIASCFVVLIWTWEKLLRYCDGRLGSPCFGSDAVAIERDRRAYISKINNVLTEALQAYDKAGLPVRAVLCGATARLWETRNIACACLAGEIHKSAYENARPVGREAVDRAIRSSSSALDQALCNIAALLVPTARLTDGRSLDRPMYHTLRVSYGQKHALVSVPLHRASCMMVLLLVDLIQRPEAALAPDDLGAFQSAIAKAKDGAKIRAETTSGVIDAAIAWLNADAALGAAIRAYLRGRSRVPLLT